MSGERKDRDRAIAEWEKVHKYGAGWKPITGGYAPDGNAFVLLYNGEKIMPYSVQSCVNGRDFAALNVHYFVALADAVLYVQNRGWDIPEDLRRGINNND